MHPLETILLGIVILLSGATTHDVQKQTTLDMKSPNVIVEVTACDPRVPTVRTKKRATVFIRCMTNDRNWDEGWTALPQYGGVLVWRAIVAGPHRPMTLPPTPKPEKQKKSEEIYDFKNLPYEAEI